MILPVSFEEVSYFNNEYRGDLIVTKGVIYYFPHTNVAAARHAQEIGGKDGLVVFEVLGNLAPILGAVPWVHAAAGKSVKAGKFIKRAIRPTTNSPKIKKLNLWRKDVANEELQKILDEYLDKIKNNPARFQEDSVPKPMRFAVNEIENVSFGLKLKFDAKFDNHDFRVNLLHTGLLRKALREGGFLK